MRQRIEPAPCMVVVKCDELVEEVTLASGIVISKATTETDKNGQQRLVTHSEQQRYARCTGKIMAMGPLDEYHKEYESFYKPGDRVYFKEYGCRVTGFGEDDMEKDLRIMRVEDILGHLREGDYQV